MTDKSEAKPQPLDGSCYEFGSFKLNDRGLYESGRFIDLPAKQLQLLREFVSRSGRLLTQDDLIKSVWPETFVETANLTNNIGKLRKLLGVNSEGQEFIKTHPRRGYSFEVEVNECDDSGIRPRAVDDTFADHGFFPEFLSAFNALIHSADEITVFFIHSRRWREDFRGPLGTFLQRPASRLNVFLPNLENECLIRQFENHFTDGPHVKSFIEDAYQDFADLARTFRGKVSIRQYDLYPTYSFYKFDDTVIVAMYPTTSVKKDVPTFKWRTGSKYWPFLLDDVERLLKLKPLSQKKLALFCRRDPKK
jgi:DNA-binding winged helix-turn-helix (wHTH) protein